jgi:DNA mismatch endonuclease (patch repair protein)
MPKKSPHASPKEQRSYTMSRIKSSNTAIEAAFTKALWHSGIRYRKNYKDLPGKPDITITKYRIAIFCDGEFWHGKDWETRKHKLKGNREYWIAKIERNINRDDKINRLLQNSGWIVMRFWGNDIQKNLAGCVEEVKEAICQAQIDLYGMAPDVCGMDE